MLAILEEQSEWLYDISEHANTWQPSFGNVAIINEGVDRAEVLLQETASHDSTMKYLADSRTFVVDHCLVVDRPWADETMANGECGKEDGRRERGRMVCGKMGEVEGREERQRKMGRRGEEGTERGKKRYIDT